MRITDAIPAPTPAPPKDYDHMNRVIRRHKSALTRAKNSGDPRKVILAVRDAFDAFDEPDMIWPDGWPTWTCAFDDAVFALRMRDFDPGDPNDAEILTAVARIEERRP